MAGRDCFWDGSRDRGGKCRDTRRFLAASASHLSQTPTAPSQLGFRVITRRRLSDLSPADTSRKRLVADAPASAPSTPLVHGGSLVHRPQPMTRGNR